MLQVIAIVTKKNVMNTTTPGITPKPSILGRKAVARSPLGIVLTTLLLAVTFGSQVVAQTISATDDGTVLKAIIFFGRHSIRATTTDSNFLNECAADPYPAFSESPGILTPNGKRAANLLGSYFHDYLVHEGLLTGSADTDLAHSYFRANTVERSYMTCAEFGAGLIPQANIPVHTYQPPLPDPIIDPLLAGVATVDTSLAVAEVQGIYGSGTDLASAYSAELSLVSQVLYPPGTQPLYPPGTPPTNNAPQGAIDPTTVPITLALGAPYALTTNLSRYLTGGVIDMGGFDDVVDAADPFVMEYCDGFPTNEVAWGRLTMDTLSEETRIATLQIAVDMRTPYLARVQSSNVGHHILSTLEQVANGTAVQGAFGDSQTQIFVIVSSDYYVAGLAGLLDLHWLLPGYQPDFCAPGGALVFELRQVRATGEYLVRVFYTAQTFNQLRNLTPLTLNTPPATMRLSVPGGTGLFTNLDVDLNTFEQLLNDAIDTNCVQSATDELLPGVMDPYTSTNSTDIAVNAGARTLTLTWPTDHQGWILQAKTNSLNAGTWVDVPGSAQVTSMAFTADPANESVFYRLRSPP